MSAIFGVCKPNVSAERRLCAVRLTQFTHKNTHKTLKKTVKRLPKQALPWLV